MKKSYIVIAAIVVALIAVVAWYVSTRNNFVKLDEGLSEQWSKVEVQYQRRLDLIPNLVETVKGYAEHESSTFENVTAARAGLSDAYNNANNLSGEAPASEADIASFSSKQQELSRALNVYVNAVREAYPTLAAGTQFQDLQTQLEGTENRIATERGRYTEAVRNYNVAVRSFPGSIVASLGGFDVKPQFKADEAASTVPKVSF